MSLRMGKRGDEKALAVLAQNSFREAFKEADFKSTFNNPSVLTLVSHNSEGEIQGYCVASHAADEAELIQIAVSAEHRKHGIGRAILDGLISLLKSQGTRQLFLEVRRSNTPAILFYESFNMKLVGTRPGFYEEPREDALIYRLDMEC